MKIIINLIIWIILILIIFTIDTYILPVHPAYTLGIGYFAGRFSVEIISLYKVAK